MEASSGLGLATIERCADVWKDLPRADRSPLRALRSAGAGRALPGRLAGAGRAQERLAARGGDRRGRTARSAAPPERRHLGHRRRPRKWEAWHRHATLCLLAHAYLVVLRRTARQEERGQKGAPVLS